VLIIQIGKEQSTSSRVPSGVCSTRPAGAAGGGKESGDEGDPRASVLTGAAGTMTKPGRDGTTTTMVDIEAHTGEAEAVASEGRKTAETSALEGRARDRSSRPTWIHRTRRCPRSQG
jgi:hypothetical protein